MFRSPFLCFFDILMDTTEAKVINLNVLWLSRQRKGEAELWSDEIKLDYGETMRTLAIKINFQTCSHDVHK